MTVRISFLGRGICTFALSVIGKSESIIAARPIDDPVKLIAPTVFPLATQARVFVVNIDEIKNTGSANSRSDDKSSIIVPSDTLWPDGDGAVILYARNYENGPTKTAHRNPWEIGKPVTTSDIDSKFFCGGVIIEEAGSGVAILNGRVVRSGDKCGPFCVVGVTPAGVILRQKGTCFMVPRGRRVTVSLVNI